MNNLLRTLTENHVKPATDLRLLLTTVKEGRRQSYDAKLSDPFYDSLDGLLVDLKTVTIDNHDAEAFLKPVPRSEYPDYYDVVANPMDFQTMLKKVKQKQYKSKREFQDDLDLIWSNCYTYNATENHPLRQCAKRLKMKAERLLKYITDRKDRTDPSIPSDLPTPTGSPHTRLNGTNGFINGYTHNRSPSYPSSTTSTAGIIKPSTPLSIKKLPRHDAPFPEQFAILRTAEGMSMFSRIDREITKAKEPTRELYDKLRELAPLIEYETDADVEDSDGSSMMVDGVIGDKRKLSDFANPHPRKRARFATQFPTPLSTERDELSELWWGAVQSDTLLANGLPEIPFPSSSSLKRKGRSPRKAKRRKKAPEETEAPKPKSLLNMMNNNIKTLKRIRHTHAKFATLVANNAAPEDAEAAEGGGIGFPPGGIGNIGGAFPVHLGPSYGTGDEEIVDDKIDERTWMAKVGAGRKMKVKGVEIGEKNALECLDWMNVKVLEHVGFQGASRSALDVLTGIASDYLYNVGRTIQYLSERPIKLGESRMTPEEIILHVLFESGNSKIQDLERYVSDDVERHGSRLIDMEKKLVGAYREITAGEVMEDEGLFDEEDEEETGALAVGDFADMLGEDYLGLRELGIAAEFGMSSLSIPKKLLRSKKTQNKPVLAKPTEPPLPFPLPPPFIPLTAAKVDDQIGLLKPYYQSRVTALSGSSSLPSLPGPSLGSSTTSNLAGSLSGQADKQLSLGTLAESKPPTVVLPDDPPNAVQVKMGPLGQVIKSGTAGAGAKKKAKSTLESVNGPPVPGIVLPGTDRASSTLADSLSSKKKKGSTGVGTGNGRKKKLGELQAMGQPYAGSGLPPGMSLPPVHSPAVTVGGPAR